MNVLGWFSRGRERHIGFMCGGWGLEGGASGRGGKGSVVWGGRGGLN